MPSNFIKILLALAGLSPTLLIVYIVNISSDFSKLTFYVNTTSLGQVLKEIANFLQVHYLLILFLLLILVVKCIISFARNNFAIGRIDVKSVKPGDSNFMTVIFSVVLATVKLYSAVSDTIFLGAFLALGIVIGLTMKSSYHFNLILKLFLGYNHYEIQTKEEITYLMVSKKQLINKREITKYVKLADHMLLNVSDKS